MRQISYLSATFLLTTGLAWACSPSGGDSSDPDGGKSDADEGNGASSGDGDADVDDDIVIEGTGGKTNDKPPAVIEETLPVGFTDTTLWGGWKVQGLLADLEEPADNSCANVLRVVIRDFSSEHIDFGSEKPATWAADGLNGWYKGQVLPTYEGDSRKPTVNPARMPLDVMEKFEEWYVNIPGTNTPYVMDIWLEPDPAAPGFFVFHSDMFFPLDAYADPTDVVAGHNFGFTTELHTAFEYKGGEIFTFIGDDDVFAFINGKLAVDIGGIHNAETESVDLDARAVELGLTVGEVYNLDLFQAERNPGASNYQIRTSLDFQSCGILEEDIVVK